MSLGTVVCNPFSSHSSFGEGCCGRGAKHNSYGEAYWLRDTLDESSLVLLVPDAADNTGHR